MADRAQTRERILRRAGLVSAVLVLLALIFLLTGHWIIGVILAVVAAGAVWAFLQVRTVR
jgi:hypothetical protein